MPFRINRGKRENNIQKHFAGLEAGGTKFICATGSDPENIYDLISFPTTTPEETLSRAIQFIKKQEQKFGPVSAVGIASFGPLSPGPTAHNYGYITTTPKPGWSNLDFVGALREHFKVPIGFDTDVNGAALGEWRWGAAQGLDNFIYLTIGTGIGGGGMINGKLIHGLMHPEMGHIPLPHDSDIDPFEGICPFHGDCFEGLASGPAIKKRWGANPETLPPDHPAWDLEASYIALALRSFICSLSPQRIILGGGVMQQPHLFPLIRAKTLATLNSYIRMSELLESTGEYIVPPALGSKSGVMGAFVLAKMAIE